MSLSENRFPLFRDMPPDGGDKLNVLAIAAFAEA
jgi:hypothetical protein